MWEHEDLLQYGMIEDEPIVQMEDVDNFDPIRFDVSVIRGPDLMLPLPIDD